MELGHGHYRGEARSRQISAAPGKPRGDEEMEISTTSELVAYLRDKKAFFREKFGVTRMGVFGSFAQGGQHTKSDIDLVVDIDSVDPFDYADSYFNLKFALQDLFKRPIDLLENKAIKNPYIRRNIDSSKSLIYARG